MYFILSYLLGMPLTAGLMGGLGNYSDDYFTEDAKASDIILMVIWPLFWTWILVKTTILVMYSVGKLIRNIPW
jgi:hypothetical protein